MSIFNSLGSNYQFRDVFHTLFAIGSKNSQAHFTKFLSKKYGGSAELTYKGRESLRLALLNIQKPGSAVVINGFTCVAVYQTIIESGYTVIFADIEKDSLNFSIKTLSLLYEKNPLISTVIIQNTLGEPCEAHAIAAFCKKNDLALIEDLAHSIGVHYETGEEAGTVGDFTVLSFGQDKVIDIVSGGALIDRRTNALKSKKTATEKVPIVKQLQDRLYPLFTFLIRHTHSIGVGKVLHMLCKKLHLLPKPLAQKGTQHIHPLPSWYASNAMYQFTRLASHINHRKYIANIYAESLNKGVILPLRDGSNQCAIFLRYPILCKQRDELITHLRKHNMHLSDIWYDAPIAPKKYMHLTSYSGECPSAENMSQHILNLPTHRSITPATARKIAHIINEWHSEQKS